MGKSERKPKSRSEDRPVHGQEKKEEKSAQAKACATGEEAGPTGYSDGWLAGLID